MSESQMTRSDLTARSNAVCQRCHESRAVARLTTPQGPGQVSSEPGSVLTLHQRAGVLAECITEARAAIDEAHGIAIVPPATGRRREVLHARRAAPGRHGRTREWRIQVGTGPFAPAAIRLQGGGAVVGKVPRVCPLAAAQVRYSTLIELLPAALMISLLGFMEAISIAKAMATRTKQKLDTNQELVGQGLANIVGSMAMSYPVSGSFSRSAVALRAGARTGVANVVSGLAVLVVLLFLSRWLYYLPQSVLAAIIILAVLRLLDFRGFVHAWRVNRVDGLVAVVTFAGTLVFAPELEWGIAMGVALSLGAYLYRTMRPTVVELAPHPDGALLRRRHELPTCRHLAVVSFEGPLNFASVAYLEDEILPGLRTSRAYGTCSFRAAASARSTHRARRPCATSSITSAAAAARSPSPICRIP